MKVNVLGRDILVKLVSEKDLRFLGGFEAGSGAWGLFDVDTIYLNASASTEQIKRTLCHELSHAVLQVSGLHNLFTDEQQEAICDSFETYLDIVRSADIEALLSQREVIV